MCVCVSARAREGERERGREGEREEGRERDRDRENFELALRAHYFKI